MSEENLQTATRFIVVWNQNPLRIAPELASFYNETNRIPDKYHLMVGPDGFIDPETNMPVEIFITDKTSDTGKKEFEVYKKLFNWADKNDEGIAVWFSPALENKYPCNKAVVSKIAYDPETMQKVILNGAILFGNEAELCIEAFSVIAPEIKEIKDPELLRNMLITLDDKFDLSPLSEFFASHTPNQGVAYLEDIKDKVQIITAMIKCGDNPTLVALEMQRQGLIGHYPVSCPPMTFSEYALARTNIIDAKFVKNCGNCGKPINAYICKGYKCSCGGVYGGC